MCTEFYTLRQNFFLLPLSLLGLLLFLRSLSLPAALGSLILTSQHIRMLLSSTSPFLSFRVCVLQPWGTASQSPREGPMCFSPPLKWSRCPMTEPLAYRSNAEATREAKAPGDRVSSLHWTLRVTFQFPRVPLGGYILSPTGALCHLLGVFLSVLSLSILDEQPNKLPLPKYFSQGSNVCSRNANIMASTVSSPYHCEHVLKWVSITVSPIHCCIFNT